MAIPLIYDKGFSNNIIGDHDQTIKSRIISQLDSDDLFVNTTWIELDTDLLSLLDKRPNRIICYSGTDWENTVCRKPVHDFLSKYNTVYIGNKNNEYYFSFWLDFVYDHMSKYQTFDPFNFDITKTFMCLNRKPHVHRIELVKELYNKNLQHSGYLSLGTFPNNGVPWDYKELNVPIMLENDVKNVEGDHAVSGTAGGITNDITGLGHPENWNSHFLNVVTETTIHTNVFLSEKIFKPILGMRPFVVLGDDAVYDKLHEWGFDTFDDILGTGYKGKYHTDRIDWILDIVYNLNREKSLNKLLSSLKTRLEFNNNQFRHIALSNKEKIYNLGLR